MTQSDYLSFIQVLDRQEALEMRAGFLAARLPAAGREALGIGADLQAPYVGYLWDYVQSRELTSESELRRRVASYPDVYLMWDLIDSSMGSEIARLAGATAVLRGRPQDLLSDENLLPEDVYLFDATQTWAASLTHEEFSRGVRYCLWSTNLLVSARNDDLNGTTQ